MKKICALILAISLVLGMGMPVFAAGNTEVTFSAPNVIGIDPADGREFVESGMAENGAFLFFEMQREVTDDYQLPKAATVTMNWKDSGVVEDVEIVVAPNYSSDLAVGKPSKTKLNGTDSVKFEVSYLNKNVALSDGELDYAEGIEVYGKILGVRTKLATLEVRAYVGVRRDIHASYEISCWDGKVITIKAESYIFAGQVKKNAIRSPHFQLSYCPFIVHEDDYVKEISFDPNGHFMFADGSYSYKPAQGEKGETVAFTVVLNQKGMDWVRNSSKVDNYGFKGMVIEYVDGCMDTGLPLVFLVVPAQGSSSSGGNSGSIGTITESLIEPRAADAEAVNSQIVGAVAAGGSGIIRLQNISSIDPAILKDAAAQAAKSNKNVMLYCDNINESGAVISRLSLPLAQVAVQKNTIRTGLSATSEATKAIENRFQKHYQNKMQVLKFEQAGAFGMNVNVAIKLNMTGMDANNLKFYTYDEAKNTYKLVAVKYSFDANGYLKFSTTVGGTLLVSSGVITAK